jgi:predicted peroxiredoxin
VKYTSWDPTGKKSLVEDTIQNGVIHTIDTTHHKNKLVEDTIQNGVKKTYSDKIPHEYDWSKQFTEEIDDIIQNGVKHTEKSLQIDGSCVIEDVIKEGVKHTEYGDWLDGDERFDDIIENGIKETTPGGYLGSVEMKGKTVHQFEHAKQNNEVEEVIQHGVIETFDETHHRRREVVRTIRDGIKQTCAQIPSIDPVVERVVGEGIKETHDDVMSHTGRVEGVIKNGIKKTVDALSSRLPNPVKDVIKNGVKICIPSRTPLYNPMDFSVQYRENHRLDDVASVLEKGIKEVQPLPSQEGNMDYSNYYYRQGDRTIPHTKYVDDAIRDGVKETWGYEKQSQDRINEVIENGTKENPS